MDRSEGFSECGHCGDMVHEDESVERSGAWFCSERHANLDANSRVCQDAADRRHANDAGEYEE